MKKYLLDTNICIALLNQTSAPVQRHVAAVPLGAIAVSAVTWTELWHGAARSQRRLKVIERLRAFARDIRIEPFDAEAAETSGAIIGALRDLGTPIGPYDALIAGHAVTLGMTLVTNNLREFQRVKGLKLVDWTR